MSTKNLSVNITPLERVARVVLGLAAVIAGARPSLSERTCVMRSAHDGSHASVHRHEEYPPRTDLEQPPEVDSEPQHHGGWGHHLMMLASCVPMLLIVFALVASGAAGSGAILYALLCTAMMAAMMFMTPGHRH